MTTSVPAAVPGQAGPPTQLGSPVLNIGIFLVFVVLTLLIVYRVSRSTTTASDLYVAGSSFTGPQHGIAISGGQRRAPVVGGDVGDRAGSDLVAAGQLRASRAAVAISVGVAPPPQDGPRRPREKPVEDLTGQPGMGGPHGAGTGR